MAKNRAARRAAARKEGASATARTASPQGGTVETNVAGGIGRISTREWRAVFGWAALILLLLALVVGHGMRLQTDDWKFSGFTGPHHNDYNSYLAWLRQAEDGHVLFKDKFTTEPHGRVFFHPLFWLMGTASRVTGASFIVVWQVVMASSIVLLCAMFYRLAADVTADRTARLLFLVLATFGSGLGWTTTIERDDPWPSRSIDIWMPEANGFQIFASDYFTLTLGLAFMIGCFIHALRHVETGRMREAVCSGVYALALAMTHQYDMVPLYAVLGVHAVPHLPRRWKGGLVILGLSLPYCLYSVAVVKLDPVFALHTQAKQEMPTIKAILLGFGLLLPLAIAGVAQRGVWRENRRIGFLLTWLLVGGALLCVPLGFERKFLLGLHVPMCLLGAVGIAGGLRRLAEHSAISTRPRTWLTGCAAALVAAVCSIGNITLYARLFERLSVRRVNDYLATGFLQGMRWLDEHSDSSDGVLCSSLTAPTVPGLTGCTVFAGHWAQTVDQAAKYAYMRNLFTLAPNPALVDEARRVFERNRVKFIVLDALSRRAMKLDDDGRAFMFTPFSREVFRNPRVVIWEVIDSPRADDTTPWSGGDWRTLPE